MSPKDERRFSADELEGNRIHGNQTLRRVLGQWDGLASLKDEIRRVELKIKLAESERCMLILAEDREPMWLEMKDMELRELKAYLRGLRYNLDCRIVVELAA